MCRKHIYFPNHALGCALELWRHFFIPQTAANCSEEDFPCRVLRNEKHCLGQCNGHKHMASDWSCAEHINCFINDQTLFGSY